MAIPGHLRNHPLFSGGRFGLMSGESPRFPATQKPTHENLVNHLRNQGIGFEETHGRYDDPERSVIIHSPTREMMADLGKHFGQESVVFSDKGKHELLYTNGEHEGKSRLTKPGSEPIDWFHEAPSNYYTHLPNHGYFGINFDFDSDPQHHGPVQVAPSAPAPMKKHDFKGAAFKHTPTGKVITTGERHELEGLDHAAFDRGEYQDGFVDSQGQFFNRDEALAAVRREGMPEPKNSDGTVELHSTDLFKAGPPSDILQVLADELGMQGWSPNKIPQSTGLTAGRIRGPEAKYSPVMLTNILDARTEQHGANLEADAQERGHTFGGGLHRAAEQQVLHDMALAPTSRDPDDENYHGGNAFHHNSLPGVMEADNFGKDLTDRSGKVPVPFSASPTEAATSVAGNIPAAAETRTAWLRSKAHPHAYDWHDGHSDHHRLAPNLEAIQKSFGLWKADLPKNDQAAGVGAPMYAKFAGPYGEVRGRATPSDLTHYNYHGKLPEIEALVKSHGFKTYFAGGKYGKPDLQAKNYNNGHLMIYGPTPSSGGDFKDHQYTNAWRQIHELSHALVYPELNSIYGEGRRIGKLGTHRTPNEAMRAVHWEWLAAHKQRDLSAKLGIHVPDEVFHKELNTVMHDAVHRAVTGQFTEPAGEGFVPHSHKVPLHIALDTVRNEAQAMGIQHPHGLAKRPMMKAWPAGATETQDSPENQANAAAHKAIIERAEVFGDKQEEQGLPRTGVHPNALSSLRSRAQIGLNRPADNVWRTAEARHANDIARFNDGEFDQPTAPPMPARAYIEGGGYDEVPHGGVNGSDRKRESLNDRDYWAGIGRAAGIQKSDPGAPLHADANTFLAALKGLPKGSPERGKFVTQHMNHGPFLAALQAHPQGVQIHKMLTGFLNSKANAGPGLPMKTMAKALPKTPQENLENHAYHNTAMKVVEDQFLGQGGHKQEHGTGNYRHDPAAILPDIEEGEPLMPEFMHSKLAHAGHVKGKIPTTEGALSQLRQRAAKKKLNVVGDQSPRDVENATQPEGAPVEPYDTDAHYNPAREVPGTEEDRARADEYWRDVGAAPISALDQVAADEYWRRMGKTEPHVILSKQGNTMSEKTYTPQEAVEVLKKAASDKIKAMEYRLQDLRKRELSKGLIPTHKHNTGSSASAAMEDVPPSKLNAPGKDDKLVGGTATQKVEESSTEDSSHGAEETSGEISAADMAKALLCKKCGKTHDLEKACDGMDKAELVDAKGNTESNSEESAATMPDDAVKHVNKPTKSKPGSGGVITKGKKLGKSLGEIRSLAKAMAPPTAKPPSGTNMATKVPTSAPKAPPMGKKAQEMDKAVDKIVVPKSQKPKVPSNERDHTVQVSKDKTVYEAKKPELEKGVMSDIAAKNNAGAPTTGATMVGGSKDPSNVKLPTPGQQEGRANMFGAAMAGEYQPPGTQPTAKLAAPAKPATALASPKAAGIAAKPAVSASPVMNAARPSKPGIFGRLLGKK